MANIEKASGPEGLPSGAASHYCFGDYKSRYKALGLIGCEPRIFI